jgi:hypothetical protein
MPYRQIPTQPERKVQMRIDLSLEEMQDLADALEMAEDRIVYTMHGLTEEDSAKAVRFRFLKERLEEYTKPGTDIDLALRAVAEVKASPYPDSRIAAIKLLRVKWEQFHGTYMGLVDAKHLIDEVWPYERRS